MTDANDDLIAQLYAQRDAMVVQYNQSRQMAEAMQIEAEAWLQAYFELVGALGYTIEDGILAGKTHADFIKEIKELKERESTRSS